MIDDDGSSTIGCSQRFNSSLRDRNSDYSLNAIFEIMVTTDNYFEISLEVSWEILIFADIKM
jgi:hypothetical protein